LCEFQPDLIFVSAGFDAHEEDQIHSPGDTTVTEFDYAWLTENLQKIANQFAKGRLISVLEGGYNIRLGPVSPLAQSVAAHVRALLNTHNGPLWRPQSSGQMTQFI
jgi:acetoin utilization deacetylase AcuC-like enzyme